MGYGKSTPGVVVADLWVSIEVELGAYRGEEDRYGKETEGSPEKMTCLNQPNPEKHHSAGTA
jgi:fructose/tagatose bisphosphate aldolase